MSVPVLHTYYRTSKGPTMTTPVTDRLRGHSFLPDAATLATIPAIYGTEDTPCAEKIVHLHYFVGACDWYVVELDAETGEAFGYANLGDDQNAEWGYISLAELSTISVPAFRFGDATVRLPVERDLHWTPGPAAAVIPRYW